MKQGSKNALQHSSFFILLFYCSILIGFISCNNNSLQIPDFTKIDFDSIQTSDKSNVLEISEPSVIELFYLQDTIKIVNYPKNEDSTKLSALCTQEIDYSFCNSWREYILVTKYQLFDNNIAVYETDMSTRFIIFKTKMHKDYFINLNKFKNKSGIIIFNGIDEPIYWEEIDKNGKVDVFLKKYFKIKATSTRTDF